MAAATSTSNVYFSLQLGDYFVPTYEPNVFLHTWSLSVEEQFYLGVPLLFVLAAAVAHWTRRDRRRVMIALIVAACAASLVSAVLLGRFAPTQAFYLPFGRVYELGIGALLAGLVLAVTPAAALMFRFDDPDALLVLLLTAAGYAVTRAVATASGRWLAGAGALVGVAFLTKMAEAFLVLPALAAAYLAAVRRGTRVIDVSPTEFKLLRYLMLNPNRVLSKAQILDHVWEYDFNGDASIVESYISYLRRKIDNMPDQTPLIHTKRGVGYLLRTSK